MTTTTDEIYLGATVRDVNDFFEQETAFLQEYYSHLKEAVARVDRMTSKHKGKAYYGPMYRKYFFVSRRPYFYVGDRFFKSTI